MPALTPFLSAPSGTRKPAPTRPSARLRGVLAGIALAAFAGWIPLAARAQYAPPGAFEPYASRQNRNVDGHQSVPCPDVGVTLILGQSNAANFVGDRFLSRRGIDRIGAGCYRSAGPTPGADGGAGSVWPLVADLMRERTQFVAMASGATSSAEWADPARLGGLLGLLIADLQARGLRVDRVLWHQGESDGATEPKVYAANVASVIARVQAAYPDARFFIAQASVCSSASRPETLAAQASLVDGVHVFAGPNTDLYNGWEDRYDGCHFSSVGARKVARAWATHINAVRP